MLSKVVTRMKETVEYIKTPFQEQTINEKGKRKRELELQEEDDCVIIDVIQTPPLKRQKYLNPQDGKKTFIRTISDFFNSMKSEWSNKYMWKPVAKQSNEQQKQSALRIDLQDAEDQMESYSKEIVDKSWKHAGHLALKQDDILSRGAGSSHDRSVIDVTDDLVFKTPAHKQKTDSHCVEQDVVILDDIQESRAGERSISCVEKRSLHKAKPSSLEKKRYENSSVGQTTRPQQESFSSTRSSWRQTNNSMSSFRSCRSHLISTASEIIRLEERNKYQELLAQVTGYEFPDITQTSSNSGLFNSVRQHENTDQQSSTSSRFLEPFSLLTPRSSLLPSVSTISTPIYHSATVIKVTPSPIKKYPDSRKSTILQEHNVRRNEPSDHVNHWSTSDKQAPLHDQVDLTSPEESSKRTILTPNRSVKESSIVSGLLNGEWTQKWRETLEPRSLERQRVIRLEERKLEALKAQKEKETADLEEQFQKQSDEEVVDSFPALTDEIEDQIDDALSPGCSTTPMVEGFRVTITKGDLATLADTTWLNDEVINFYLNLVMERSKQKEYPTAHVFNTFFYSTLIKQGYARVKRWTKKIDIFSMDLIIAPIHLEYHWCLAVIDLRAKCIYYYDSLRGKNPKCLAALREYLKEESKDKKKTSFDLTGWTEQSPQDVPQQLNGCDCGVFACKYAEYISRDSPFDFTQEHMPYFRRRMVYEILSKTLM